MDVPDVDMLTLATPVKDVEQPVGRILRHHALKMHPVIVDFVDQHRTLIRWARERTMYYKREGFQLLTPIPV
jgi:superfamily II DNA or RNA helicase